MYNIAADSTLATDAGYSNPDNTSWTHQNVFQDSDMTVAPMYFNYLPHQVMYRMAKPRHVVRGSSFLDSISQLNSAWTPTMDSGYFESALEAPPAHPDKKNRIWSPNTLSDTQAAPGPQTDHPGNKAENGTTEPMIQLSHVNHATASPYLQIGLERSPSLKSYIDGNHTTNTTASPCPQENIKTRLNARIAKPTRSPRPTAVSFRTVTKTSYVCTFGECSKQFSRLYDLHRHHRSAHERVLVFPCRFAGCEREKAGFSRKDKRDDHERKMHENLPGTNQAYTGRN